MAGASAGNRVATATIIATIITTHMPRNDDAAPGHVCPGIRVHAIDIVQSPAIGISPIAIFVQRLLYSPWRRHHMPVSLRPRGARSSHWYMPQRPSSPRA